ncbi:MAG: ABC transporter ATP-binding protein, partial [Gemmatimonadetes bacterium]|nr:ABC transporter ATP-binding protein [Gemmatimonadota bacterium]
RWSFTSLSRFVERDLRMRFIHQLLLLPLSFFSRQRVGDLMTRATSDVEMVQRFLHHGFRMTLFGILTFFLSLVVMCALDWRLALISLAPMPLLIIVTNRVHGRFHAGYRAIQEQFATLSARIQENLAGVRVVKAFAREQREIAEFSQENDEYVERNQTMVVVRSLFYPFTGILNGISLAVVLWLGGLRVIDGSLSLGAFVAFNAYLIRMSRPMYMLGRMVDEFQRAGASMARIERILQEEPEIRDRDGRDVRGEIEFRDVVLKYGESVALDRVSFRVEAGKTLAVVGRVGSGKSTVAKLIPRLLTPSEGMILIDGVPLEQIPLASLRDAIGFVPQDGFLFSETLRTNINLGAPTSANGQATATTPEIDPEDDADKEGADLVSWAATVSQLSADLPDLPEGLETVVGERGVTLSGGQRQRTALARAVVREPSILILDDALASVDTHTEDAILQGLRKVMETRTTIIIAHRLSSVRDADHILVLDEGRIAEEGTHQQLLDAGGMYADMHRRQSMAQELTEL